MTDKNSGDEGHDVAPAKENLVDGVSNANEDERSIAKTYNSHYARAKAREDVREFINEVKDDWCGPAKTDELKSSNVRVADLMRLKTQTATQFRWFAIASLWLTVPLVLIVGLIATGYWAPSQSSSVPFLAIAGAAIAAFSISASIYFINQTNLKYKRGVDKLADAIELKITNYISERGGTLLRSAGGVQPTAATEQEQESYRRSMVATFEKWRSLERLPYYIRHEWDDEINSVNDHQNIPRYFWKRRLSYFLPVFLVFLALIYSFVSTAPFGLSFVTSDAPTSPPTITLASVIATFIVLHLVSGVVQAKSLGALPLFDIVNAAGLVIVGTGLVFIPEGSARDFVALMAFCTLAASFLTGFSVAEIARRANRETVRVSGVRISNKLRTHTKAELLDRLEMKMQDFLKRAEIETRDGTWDGWTDKYMDQKRQRLAQEGYSEREIEYEIAMDPVIYVGGMDNRRLEVCRFDPASNLLQRIPMLLYR